MSWNPTQIDSEILAVHAALVPNGPLGEVVLFGGDEHWSAQQETAANDSWKKTRVYDVATHALVPGQVQSPDSDVFCAHHVFIGDGRLLIAGGTSEWPLDGDGHAHDLAFLGHSRCWLYNPRARKWVETARLNRNSDQPDEPRSGGRWYPGLAALGDGSALALFGHLDVNDFRHRNNTPERYYPGRHGWVDLPEIMGGFGEPNEDGRRYLFFPRAHVLPSGKVFSATPMPVDFASQADGSDGPHFSTAFDPDTAAYTTPRAAGADGVDGNWSYPAVLLPLLPKDGAYNARMLYTSGAQPKWIDTDAASPGWSNTGPRDASLATRARTYSNSVILPTGQVCVVGGMANVDPEDPVLQAEIYTPDIDWTTNSYGAGGGTWSLDSSSAINARNYHSTALLLPNGKVWVSGGNVRANSGNPATVGILKIELYEPSYIAIANRIAITTAPTMVGYNQPFDVTIDRPATDIGRVVLIRNGSVTHSTNNDQRMVGLEIVSRSGNTISVEAPPTGNVAPPGYYMLWVIDTAGNPCQAARFVRVAHLSCRAIANRSTFSEEEVQALAGGGSARFQAALLVDFDGFLAAELTGIPTASLTWSDGAGAVASSTLRTQFVQRQDETSPPDPDVPTRITFIYDLFFDTQDAFTGWLDGRDITATFTLNGVGCTATLNLTKSPNPYMIDVDPAFGNPHWLSTDVRVFKVRAFETQLGATMALDANGPWTYIRSVIDRLRSGAENFESVPREGDDIVLDGAYMSGFPPMPTFNFAIARVRYRAISTVAQDVRCFFRMCNVAATGLEFDTDSVYRRSPGSTPVPLLGTAGGQLVSIPFFNAQRQNSVTGQSSAASMASQPLDTNYDIQDITPNASGDEVTAYFGCFLDINTPTKRFPIAPSGDGPFPDASSLPIRDLLRSWHNCIVAEILIDGDDTRLGAGPADSDNLSQRNLTIIGLENPGHSASRTAMHTFEVAPSGFSKSSDVTPATSPIAQFGLTGKRDRRIWPDELMFDWHNLPADTLVTLYFSDIDTAEIETMLIARISPASFTVMDSSTIRFRIGDCGWLPLPGGRDVRIPVLISIALPDGIVEGQVYRTTVRQVNGRTGKVIGTIEIEMPVSKAAFLRFDAERKLSFIGHLTGTLAHSDRWRPLFVRLLGHLAATVDALGGKSRDIKPNPDGTGEPAQPSGWTPGNPFPPDGFATGDPCQRPDPCGKPAPDDDCPLWPMWLIAIASAFGLLAIGILPPALALVVALVALLVIVIAIVLVRRLCTCGAWCRAINGLLIGSVAASAILAIGASLYPGTVNLAALAISGVLAIGSMIASFLGNCLRL